jgi:hypothetical protein
MRERDAWQSTQYVVVPTGSHTSIRSTTEKRLVNAATCEKTALFLSAFPMFVPSLSW